MWKRLRMPKSLTHKHHIIPRHMGGQDSAGNIVELTVEEHAEAHHALYEKYGHWQDKLAWKGLSGRITKEEAMREATRLAHKGKVVSEETKQKQSVVKRGKLNPMYGTVSPNAGKFGEDSPRWGMTHSDETKRKLSKAAKNRERVDCSDCMRTGILPAHFARYHKDEKCKEK